MAHKDHALSRERSLDYYSGERAKRSRRKLALGIVVTIALILCAVSVAVGMYVTNVNASMNTNDEELLASLKKGAKNEPFYLLLLGADKGEERYEDIGEDESLYRADSIILCRIDPTNIKATLVSIHRDLYVELEDGTDGKINAAYSIGGPAGMVRQVSKLAGVDISHYAEIDFDSFMQIIDELGGVEVTLPTDISDPDYTGLELSAGTHTLNAHDALMLSRSRHAYDEYGDGDLYRAANQRAIIASMLRKILAQSPHDMLASITTLSKSLTTDMTVDEILTIAAQFRDFNTETDLYSGMTPSEPEMIDEVYYEILDVPVWTEMMQRVDAGEPPFSTEDDDITAGIASSTSKESPIRRTIADGNGTDANGTLATSKPKGSVDLSQVSKNGSVMIAGYPDGTATTWAEELSELGFDASGYEDTEFTFDRNLVVYADESLAEEAEAIAQYLGDDFEAILNDGSFMLMSDIVVRVMPQ
ncbi:MAG: LCP family protein [Atopobiaceae bacterium]|nr:LCP family protein [Atopobiaceae bacterium]